MDGSAVDQVDNPPSPFTLGLNVCSMKMALVFCLCKYASAYTYVMEVFVSIITSRTDGMMMNVDTLLRPPAHHHRARDRMGWECVVDRDISTYTHTMEHCIRPRRWVSILMGSHQDDKSLLH